MYRDAYPSDRAIDAAPLPAGYFSGDEDPGFDAGEAASFRRHAGYDEDDHEAAWAQHLHQFAHARGADARTSRTPSEPPAQARPARPAPRRHGPLLLLLTAATVPAVAMVAMAGRSGDDPGLSLQTIVRYAPQAAVPLSRESVTPVPVARHAWMLDRTPTMGDQATTMDGSAPLEAAFLDAPMQLAEAVEALEPPPAKYERAPLLRPKPAEPRQLLAQTVPLPLPRPADLMPPRPVARVAVTERAVPVPTTTGSIPAEPQRLVERQDPRRRDLPSTQSVFRAAMPGRAPGGRGGESALAYAGTNEEAIDASPRARLGLSLNPASGQTAIYDISAQRVYLPSGRVLEAHSGKGPYMDDPRYVHLRMRGATPPGTYMLTERERPYHGVRALRMTPVGGTAAIHGRDGILAHTYMLRQRGASHGCVVFADYRSFLSAYLNGEIRQIRVVAGAKGGALPSVASRVGGFFDRWASAGD